MKGDTYKFSRIIDDFDYTSKLKEEVHKYCSNNILEAITETMMSVLEDDTPYLVMLSSEEVSKNSKDCTTKITRKIMINDSIVFCKDCIYRHNLSHFCHKTERTDYDFCSKGMKKLAHF